MSLFDKKPVPKQFVTDFETVATYYQLRELGEYETAKTVARNDMDNAIICYAAIAKSLS